MDAIVNYGASRFEVQRDGQRIAVFDRIEDARKFCAVDELLEAAHKAYIEICATCVYPDDPYSDGAFPQLDNPADARCLADAITILDKAISKSKG